MALFILQGGTFLFQMNFGKLDINGDRKDRIKERLSKNDKKKFKKNRSTYRKNSRNKGSKSEKIRNRKKK